MSKKERLSFRLQYAQRLMQASMDRSRNPELGSANDWLRKTEKALADAKKDNDFIYHERIPDEKSLASVGKAVVAKATPMPPKYDGFCDLMLDGLESYVFIAFKAWNRRRFV